MPVGSTPARPHADPGREPPPPGQARTPSGPPHTPRAPAARAARGTPARPRPAHHAAAAHAARRSTDQAPPRPTAPDAHQALPEPYSPTWSAPPIAGVSAPGHPDAQSPHTYARGADRLCLNRRTTGDP